MAKLLNRSESRTYVVPIYDYDFAKISFRKFHLPLEYDNMCSVATWYFYNRLDYENCGEQAYPIEMHNDIKEI